MSQSGARTPRKTGQPIARRALRAFDCFRQLRTPPDDEPHYAVAIFVYELVAIVAVGTTKHITDPCFFEADETTRRTFGLPLCTRFLDCFVHAFWHGGTPVEICGEVHGKKQLAFKQAGERALVAHATGNLIPTIPARSDLAALPSPTLADAFLVELHEIARQFAPARKPAIQVPSSQPYPLDDDGDDNTGSS